MKLIKDVFLISRVERAFKKKVLKRAMELGKSLSDFVREAVERALNEKK